MILPVVLILAVVMVLVTARLPRVPTVVMFVWLAVCMVPVKLVANTLPVPLTTPAPNITLPAVTLPETLRVVPVAPPMLGVVSCALALTMILPVPSNAVVTLSVRVLISVPAIAIPLPASNTELVLNTAKVILLVPKVILPAGALTTNAVPAFTLPSVVKK